MYISSFVFYVFLFIEPVLDYISLCLALFVDQREDPDALAAREHEIERYIAYPGHLESVIYNTQFICEREHQVAILKTIFRDRVFGGVRDGNSLFCLAPETEYRVDINVVFHEGHQLIFFLLYAALQKQRIISFLQYEQLLGVDELEVVLVLQLHEFPRFHEPVTSLHGHQARIL
jgi:hypothetical protein